MVAIAEKQKGKVRLESRWCIELLLQHASERIRSLFENLCIKLLNTYLYTYDVCTRERKFEKFLLTCTHTYVYVHSRVHLFSHRCVLEDIYIYNSFARVEFQNECTNEKNGSLNMSILIKLLKFQHAYFELFMRLKRANSKEKIPVMFISQMCLSVADWIFMRIHFCLRVSVCWWILGKIEDCDVMLQLAMSLSKY